MIPYFCAMDNHTSKTISEYIICNICESTMHETPLLNTQQTQRFCIKQIIKHEEGVRLFGGGGGGGVSKSKST